jgi:hypothetical protein
MFPISLPDPVDRTDCVQHSDGGFFIPVELVCEKEGDKKKRKASKINCNINELQSNDDNNARIMHM